MPARDGGRAMTDSHEEKALLGLCRAPSLILMSATPSRVRSAPHARAAYTGTFRKLESGVGGVTISGVTSLFDRPHRERTTLIYAGVHILQGDTETLCTHTHCIYHTHNPTRQRVEESSPMNRPATNLGLTVANLSLLKS